jgi:hypothetical protein
MSCGLESARDHTLPIVGGIVMANERALLPLPLERRERVGFRVYCLCTQQLLYPSQMQ